MSGRGSTRFRLPDVLRIYKLLILFGQKNTGYSFLVFRVFLCFEKALEVAFFSIEKNLPIGPELPHFKKHVDVGGDDFLVFVIVFEGQFPKKSP